MDSLDLAAFDVDGALQETAEKAGHTRLDFLRKAGVAGGAVAGGGALLGVIAPAASAHVGPATSPTPFRNGRPPVLYGLGDTGILNFALALEYLESAFYNEAAAGHAITDPATSAFLQTVVRDENAHVALLKSVLGSKAIPSPTFDFQGIPENQTKFQQTANVLENTGVHAYLGQASNVRSRSTLTTAAGIATIEGRHAAIIGSILSDTATSIAPNGPVDTPLTADQVLTAVGGTGFVTGGLPPML